MVWHETCLTGTEGVTAEEINKFYKLHLVRYKVPKQVEFRGELPKSLLGRYLRRVLVEAERAKAPGSASVTGSA